MSKYKQVLVNDDIHINSYANSSTSAFSSVCGRAPLEIANMSAPTDPQQAKSSAVRSLKAWGEHSIPPMGLAALIFAQNARPFRLLPMIFPPLLTFSSYINVAGYKVDSAGMTASWSGLHLLLAARRRQQFTAKFSPRGILRGATLGLCAVNLVGCGIAYVFGSRSKEEPRLVSAKDDA